MLIKVTIRAFLVYALAAPFVDILNISLEMLTKDTVKYSPM